MQQLITRDNHMLERTDRGDVGAVAEPSKGFTEQSTPQQDVDLVKSDVRGIGVVPENRGWISKTSGSFVAASRRNWIFSGPRLPKRRASCSQKA